MEFGQEKLGVHHPCGSGSVFPGRYRQQLLGFGQTQFGFDGIVLVRRVLFEVLFQFGFAQKKRRQLL